MHEQQIVLNIKTKILAHLKKEVSFETLRVKPNKCPEDAHMMEHDRLHHPPEAVVFEQQQRLSHLKYVRLRNLDLRPPTGSRKHRPSIVHSSPSSRVRRNTLIEYTEDEKPSELQNINLDKLVDSFISIHEWQQEEPFHITEVRHHCMDPDFSEILIPSDLGSRTIVTLKIWSKRSNESINGWKLLYLLHVNLNQLQLIDANFDELDLDPNTVILQLKDSNYLANNFKSKYNHITSNQNLVPDIKTTTCSYDSIRKLNNLSFCIRDNEAFKNRLANDISEFIELKSQNYNERMWKHNQSKIKNSIMKENLAIEVLKRKLNQKKIKLKSQQKIIKGDTLNKYKEELLLSRESFGQLLSSFHIVKESLEFERSRMLRNINDIFPIQNIEGASNFEILHIQVPLKIDSQPKVKDLKIDAALGYISQLVYLLQHYLCVSLRYPVYPYGSKSYITDPISQITGSRVFPLWLQDTAALSYRFEYAITLLNENILQLIEANNLKVPESKNMLGNLKSLLLCLSSYDPVESTAASTGSPGSKLSVITQSFSRRGSKYGTDH